MYEIVVVNYGVLWGSQGRGNAMDSDGGGSVCMANFGGRSGLGRLSADMLKESRTAMNVFRVVMMIKICLKGYRKWLRNVK